MVYTFIVYDSIQNKILKNFKKLNDAETYIKQLIKENKETDISSLLIMKQRYLFKKKAL